MPRIADPAKTKLCRRLPRIALMRQGNGEDECVNPFLLFSHGPLPWCWSTNSQKAIEELSIKYKDISPAGFDLYMPKYVLQKEH